MIGYIVAVSSAGDLAAPFAGKGSFENLGFVVSRLQFAGSSQEPSFLTLLSPVEPLNHLLPGR